MPKLMRSYVLRYRVKSVYLGLREEKYLGLRLIKGWLRGIQAAKRNPTLAKRPIQSLSNKTTQRIGSPKDLLFIHNYFPKLILTLITKQKIHLTLITKYFSESQGLPKNLVAEYARIQVFIWYHPIYDMSMVEGSVGSSDS